MRLHPASSFRRSGFTLIEVLVAAGLCMLIMSVLAAAFASGIDTFSLLKSTGELNERLKTATTILRNDLQAPHLEADTGEPVKVSQLRLDHVPLVATDVWPTAERFDRPQPKGFFRIKQENASVLEGNDPDGVPSTRATDHILQMAVRLAATRSDRVSTAKLPPGPGLSPTEQNSVNQVQGLSLLNIDPTAGRFAGQWSEVSYFLSTSPTGTTAGGLSLFSLHRRVRVLLPMAAAGTTIDWTSFNKSGAVAADAPRAAPGMSSRVVTGPANILNTIADIVDPNARLGGLAATRGTNINQLSPLGTGEDILLTNVLSFEVKASWDDRFGGTTVTNEFPFADLPVVANNTTLAGLRIFDTWSSSLSSWDSTTPPTVPGAQDNRVPSPIRLKAIQIKLRIYDPKNRLTRQITMIQDL